ncbi:reverse transcriptase domain-containing protein [Tanacetum coccineum]
MEEEVIRDIEETFKTLREINMKLNPKKCTFGMREGTFLGYKMDTDGLRVCPDKVEAVLSLPSPKCLKDVQKLNGKLASLNRFLSKSAEKSLPFFKTLKNRITHIECAKRKKDELIMYLAAAKEAISAVLMTERDGKQMPIYFVSRALQGPEVNYTPMEKLILALVTGRLLKWRFELEEHDIHYRPRTFNATNNEAEYEALIAGLRIARQIGVQNLQANVDSKLVANQVNKVYVAKESSMIKYLKKVKNLASTCKEFSIKQVPRGENKKADALSKIASTSFAHLSKQVLVEELKKKSIDKKEVLVVVEEEGHTLMTPIYEYLTKEILPEEKSKARAIRRRAGSITWQHKYYMAAKIFDVYLAAFSILSTVAATSCSNSKQSESIRVWEWRFAMSCSVVQGYPTK